MLDIVKDLLKGANPIIILLLAFLIWQVVNHIPSQIKDLDKKVDSNHKELKLEIQDIRKEIYKNHNEIKDLIIEFLIEKEKEGK